MRQCSGLVFLARVESARPAPHCKPEDSAPKRDATVAALCGRLTCPVLGLPVTAPSSLGIGSSRCFLSRSFAPSLIKPDPRSTL